MKTYLYKLATDQERGLLAGLLKIVLLLLSWVYGIIIRCTQLLYKSAVLKTWKLGKPVISVGNITWGGAGKTPMVELIAKYLKAKSYNVVILTRGYMGRSKSAQYLKSDEVEMMRKSLKDIPVLVGANRYKNAAQFSQNNPVDIYLLDDGFQHWRLFRDVDIVTIDTINPFGNKAMIPRGILREPLKSLLKAQVIVLTKTDLGENNVGAIKGCLKDIGWQHEIFETIHKPTSCEDLRTSSLVEEEYIKDKELCYFCSIGNPRSFEETLNARGAKVRKGFTYLDDHVYKKDEVRQMNAYCQEQDIKLIITTQKDAVKIVHLLSMFDNGIRVLALNIVIDFVSGRDKFFERIDHFLPS